MSIESIVTILLLPFLGTSAGAACVFFMKREIALPLRKALVGFAAGVMVAASVWSLLIPSMEVMEGSEGIMKVIPASMGFFAGILFLLLIDKITPHQHLDSDVPEGPKSRLSRASKLALAVTIHNIPEGIAIGIILAGVLEESGLLSVASAMALSVGLAIQNFPEGAIVSMPMHEMGNSRPKAFGMGVASGAVEPIAALLTLAVSTLVLPLFPYLLAFGAGAMIYVVVEELIPETAEGEHTNGGTIGFAVGFVMMMILDTLLG